MHWSIPGGWLGGLQSAPIDVKTAGTRVIVKYLTLAAKVPSPFGMIISEDKLKHDHLCTLVSLLLSRPSHVSSVSTQTHNGAGHE